MKCHYCGTELSGHEIFCRFCGTRLEPVPQQEPAPVAAAEPAPAVAAEPAPAVAIPAAVAVEAAPVPRPAPVYEEKTFDWQPYGAPVKEEPLFDFEKTVAPKIQLPTKRGLGKMIFLSILTLGIYPMVIWSRLVGEVNMVASRYDGERSMSFFGMLMLSPLTLGIHSLVWMHKLCRRIGAELERRGTGYKFGAKDFWLWCFLMGLLSSICSGVCAALYGTGFDVYAVLLALAVVCLLTLVGPFIFLHKLMKSMNKLNEDFNLRG